MRTCCKDKEGTCGIRRGEMCTAKARRGHPEGAKGNKDRQLFSLAHSFVSLCLCG